MIYNIIYFEIEQIFTAILNIAKMGTDKEGKKPD